MKKITKLLLAIVLTLAITGCGDKKEEDVIATKTCTQQGEGYVQIHKITATNDNINKIELVIEYDNSLFGVESLNILNDDQKEQIKTNMLKTLGLESDTYEGLEINVTIEEEMTVSVKADLEKADTTILKKVGLDFSETDMSFSSAIKSYEETGAICE